MAISHIGTANGTTSATQAYLAGDLLVAEVFRNGSTTAPTVPGGWTGKGTALAVQTAYSRVYTQIAASSGSSSGTWTNASRVIFRVYRGASDIGTPASGSGSGASVSFPALTRTVPATSWVGRTAFHRTSTTMPTPGGVAATQRTITSGNPIGAGFDSNGVAGANPTVNSVTASASSGWHAWTYEILEAATATTVTPTGIADAGGVGTPSVVGLVKGWYGDDTLVDGATLTTSSAGANDDAFSLVGSTPVLRKVGARWWIEVANTATAHQFRWNDIDIAAFSTSFEFDPGANAPGAMAVIHHGGHSGGQLFRLQYNTNQTVSLADSTGTVLSSASITPALTLGIGAYRFTLWRPDPAVDSIEERVYAPDGSLFFTRTQALGSTNNLTLAIWGRQSGGAYGPGLFGNLEVANTGAELPPVASGATSVSPAGIATAAAMGAIALTLGALTLGLTGIASAEALGVPTVSATITSSPSGISTAAAPGTPTVSATAPTTTLSPAGITDGSGVGSPAVSATISTSPAGIPTAAALGAPGATGVVTSAPSGIGSGAVPGTPAASTAVTASPAGIADPTTVGTPAASSSLTAVPEGVPTAGAAGDPAAQLGVVTSAPAGISSATSTGSPEAVVGELVASPTGVPSAATLGAPAASPVIAVGPSGVGSLAEVGTPAATVPTTSTPAGIGSAAQPGAPSAAAVWLATPAGIGSATGAGEPGVAFAVQTSPTGIPTGAAAGTPQGVLGAALSPEGIASAAAVGSPSATGTVSTSPAGVAAAAAAGTPAVSTATSSTPTGISTGQGVGSPGLSTSLTASPDGVATAAAAGAPSATSTVLVGPDGVPSGVTVGAPVLVTGSALTPTGIPSLAVAGNAGVDIECRRHTERHTLGGSTRAADGCHGLGLPPDRGDEPGRHGRADGDHSHHRAAHQHHLSGHPRRTQRRLARHRLAHWRPHGGRRRIPDRARGRDHPDR